MAIDRRARRGDLAIATLFAVLLIVSAPFVGQVRAAVRSALPAYFAVIIGGLVAVALGAAIVIALARIRDRRVLRYFTLAGALVVGATFARVLRTGNADVDVVETFHFVEYGFLTLLFYRAWRRLDDVSVFVLPMLAGVLVGTLDEWFQWFIPARVGEMRDVLLDGVAVACGLLFSIGFDPPDRFSFALRRGSPMRIGMTAGLASLVFALFFQTVHLGYEVRSAEIGSFRSRYTGAELESAARDRSGRWRDRPPLVLARVSREDQYMSEALWHVQRRNEAWTAGNLFAAFRENRILEIFYAPVLDTPSYVSRTGHRWPADQRAAAARLAGTDSRLYVSDAEPYPIFVWPKAIFWMVIAMVIAAIIWLSASAERRRSAPRTVSA